MMSIFLTNRILSLIIKTLALINIRACGILCVTRPKKLDSPMTKAQQTSRLCELRDVEPFALKGPNVDHDHPQGRPTRGGTRRTAPNTLAPEPEKMANLTAAHEWQLWPNQVADEKGLFADLAGDFRQPALGDHQIRSPKTHKAGIAGSFSRFLRELGQTLERLAGDAVQIAPVSGQIPCKQGILQGKSRIWADRRKSQSRKPLCRRDFSMDSLSKLSGNSFRRTGIFRWITGI